MIEAFDIPAFMGAFCRAVGMLFFLPLSMTLLNVLFRFGLGLMLALIGLFWGGSPAGTPYLYDVLIGVVLALPFLLGHQLIAGWGELLDTQRGQSFGFLYDSSSGEQSLPTAQLLGWLFFAVCAASGAFALLIFNYLSSFSMINTELLSFVSLAEAIFPVIVATLTRTFMLFLPLATLFVLVDILFGIISRFSPGGLVQGEAFLLKSLFGLGVVYLAFGRSDLLLWLQSLAVIPIDKLLPTYLLN